MILPVDITNLFEYLQKTFHKNVSTSRDAPSLLQQMTIDMPLRSKNSKNY